MTEINLLPWREQRREQDKKLFTTILSSGIVGACAIVFLGNYYANHLVNTQLERNNILQNEINNLDNHITEIRSLKTVRAGLISRMTIVQNLQSTRTLMVHLFDELIKILPPGIYITKVERKNDVVSVWGYAESNINIAQMMTNIENNEWIQTPLLTESKVIEDKEKKDSERNQFLLSFILKPRKLGI